jgi:hypothetical protein
VNSQFDALAERIAFLSVNVSTTSLFKQMEKLEVAKKDLQKHLLKVKEINLTEWTVVLKYAKS